MAKREMVTEWQIGVATPEDWPLVAGAYRGRICRDHLYLGPLNGLYAFAVDGSGAELFQRTLVEHHSRGWHLRRGSYAYEFVRRAND